VPEGEEPDCAEQASSPHAVEWAERSEGDAGVTDSPHALKTLEAEPDGRSKAAVDAKPAKRVKSKTARSRPLRSFLREVDLLPYLR
jgi:hypothetical protein